MPECGKIQLKENPYFVIFYAVYSLTYKQIFGYRGIFKTSLDIYDHSIITNCYAVYLTDDISSPFGVHFLKRI